MSAIAAQIISGSFADTKNPLTLMKVEQTEPPHAKALKLLDEYAYAKDREKFGMELVKTYNRRRQSAYKAYLQEFDKLSKNPSFDDSVKVLFSEKLQMIQEKFNGRF